ncbi:hypothetical protein M441DRAFT_374938 [Trichoderma asperellum CBS 433.97]|uniref:Uncharacterized protein n=1 Tax=Trichoderma asperellum (strain ATCC 204424 / CBS 433.97 / NBRC 101777) TaxID=1042311 RepID=A0A2T3ZFG5_TRIA4|nr:hypothetical protein M441DRAFT_374938 [Trichoderma asperellum CBS 433.97]PTB43558.1 hypothetical protein M441DRAFT_374938 [Trichoderma asperellum CBS 433.97]
MTRTDNFWQACPLHTASKAFYMRSFAVSRTHGGMGITLGQTRFTVQMQAHDYPCIYFAYCVYMIARHNGNPYISSTKRAINEQQEIGQDSISRSFCHAKLSLHNPLGDGDSPLSDLGTERVWRQGG